MQFLREPSSFPLCPLMSGKILKAVHGADEFSIIPEQRRDIDEDGNSRGIGPLDDHFHVPGGLSCPKNPLHGRLAVRQNGPVRAEQLVRAAIFLVDVASRRGTSPQLGSTPVVGDDNSLGVADKSGATGIGKLENGSRPEAISEIARLGRSLPEPDPENRAAISIRSARPPIITVIGALPVGTRLKSHPSAIVAADIVLTWTRDGDLKFSQQ
jgi:hypothetical protein